MDNLKLNAGDAEALAITPERVSIDAPNIKTAPISIIGISPYVQCKFSVKAIEIMESLQRQGSQKEKGKKKKAKDFQAAYEGAMHKAAAGWNGIPAAAFRNAMISACRVVGFKMTLGKLGIFVEPDGFDGETGEPLVKIHGKPRIHKSFVRLANGSSDVRWRPMWEKWSCDLRLSYDGDMFTAADVVNLLARAGLQVGIGEGRNDSRKSCGMGWGSFKIKVEK